MAESGELVVAAFGQRGISGVNLQPGSRQRHQADRRVLAVVPDRSGAQHPNIPVFQGGGIGGGNSNVFNGKVHDLISTADYADSRELKNQIRVIRIRLMRPPFPVWSSAFRAWSILLT